MSLMPADLDLAAELAEVEAAMEEVLQDRSGLVVRLGRHTAEAGGKRLRPTLCLLAGRLGRPDRREKVVRAAAGLELIHLASLIHDDVVDQASTRRGRPTVSALWGNGLAVLAGDWLFASSFDLLHANDDPRIILAATRMIRALCAGAIEEAEQAGRLGASLQDYYDRIYRKTAVFLENACRIGAMAARADHETVEALASYGRRLGLAFQIADDLLDLTGDPALTGKPVGGDLRNGIATLPMILGRRHAEVAPLLKRSFGSARAGGATVRTLVAVLERAGALAASRQAAADLAVQAVRALRPLGGGAVGDKAVALALLTTLADQAPNRDR